MELQVGNLAAIAANGPPHETELTALPRLRPRTFEIAVYIHVEVSRSVLEQSAIVCGKVNQRLGAQGLDDEKAESCDARPGSLPSILGGRLGFCLFGLCLPSVFQDGERFLLLFGKFLFFSDDRIACLQLNNFAWQESRRKRHDSVGNLLAHQSWRKQLFR